MSGEILNDIRSVLRLPSMEAAHQKSTGFDPGYRAGRRDVRVGRTRNGFVKEVVGGTRFELVTPAV